MEFRFGRGGVSSVPREAAGLSEFVFHPGHRVAHFVDGGPQLALIRAFVLHTLPAGVAVRHRRAADHLLLVLFREGIHEGFEVGGEGKVENRLVHAVAGPDAVAHTGPFLGVVGLQGRTVEGFVDIFADGGGVNNGDSVMDQGRHHAIGV